MPILDDVPYLTPNDLKTGDVFEILSEGKFVSIDNKEESRESFVIDIKLLNGKELGYFMNKTSRLKFILEFGKDTTKWIGKKGIFEKIKQNVFGELKEVIYSEPKI